MKSNITLKKKQVGSYAHIASELSGQSVDIDQWEKGRAMSERLIQQSHDIAKKMESVGFSAYDHKQDLKIFGLHSKQVIDIPNFRNICIIPSVARKKRNRASKELEYFLQRNPNARTWVHTTGNRCTLKELPQRIEWLHAKFGRVNSQSFMKTYGAKFVFRSTEFGEIAQTEDGLSFHPHAHSVLVLERKLTRMEWDTFLKKVKTYFVYHSKDCGKIKSVKELVKYCVKPSDLEHLSGSELVSIHEVCTNKRLVEFLGQLRNQRKFHNQENFRLIRRKGILTKTRNWNTGKEKTPRYLDPVDHESGCRPIVVAWIPPTSIFTPITEPCFVVHALGSNDPSNVFNSFEVRSMEQQIKCLSIKVHTKTLTHQQGSIKNNENDESKTKIYKKDPRLERVRGTITKFNEVFS